MKKRILILTAGFGEGHNSAARGVRDGLARVAPNQTDVELRDLFAEAYGLVNEFVRRSYLALVNSAPRAWGIVYRWLDRKTDYDTEFRRFTRLKSRSRSTARAFSPGHRRLLFPGLRQCASGDFGAREILQMCGGRHGLDHHQRYVVPEPRRLFPRCERTERLRLASSGSRAGKNQGIWISREPEICRFHQRSTITFQQFEAPRFVHDPCRDARRAGTGAVARKA